MLRIQIIMGIILVPAVSLHVQYKVMHDMPSVHNLLCTLFMIKCTRYVYVRAHV